jgi:cell division protease FtsH
MDEQRPQEHTRITRVAILTVVAIALAVELVLVFGSAPSERDHQPDALSHLAQQLKAGQITSLEVGDDRVLAVTATGERYAALLGRNSLFDVLRDFGVTPDDLANVASVVEYPPPTVNWFGGATLLLPAVLLGAILLFSAGRGPGPNQELMSFGKSRARRFFATATATTFQDVAGVDEAKQELEELVEFLRNPWRFADLGARIPKGVLLCGPPGLGKTLLARAVAGEACVPFYSMSASEFVEMFAGVGASRVRDLFDQARRNAPCIVFVDELDAVGRRRGSGVANAHQEREQTLNQILVEMDGFDSDTNVIVIAATNRPDVLDPALLRPGRFDRQVVLAPPDSVGRRQILQVHFRGRPIEATVDLSALARVTAGFSGADLANLVNEGAIVAARRNKTTIGMVDLEEAVDRVIAGPECKSRVLSERDKELTAYHEGGHALVMRYVPHHDPVYKITLVRRGRTAGYTRPLPREDRYYRTRGEFEAMLAAAMGGHAAEQVVFGEISTSAENDIQKATGIARMMVKTYGMSERLGSVAVGDQPNSYSDKTAEAIDAEIRRLIDEAYALAIGIITDHRAVLDSLARALLHHEVLEGAALERPFQSDGLHEV